MQWRWTIFLTGFLLTVSDFLYFYALSDPEALLSVLSPIRRSGVVFTFVVGAILFHERQIKVKAAILAVVLAGTMLLLEEEEKRMIKGTIINKFRGDVKILEPGLKMLEDIIHIPTLGVVPYLHLDVDDEDSLSERFSSWTTRIA